MTVKPKASRTRLSPDRRRSQLLRCAIGAFAQYGIARATHAHVARRCGVSVSAVHSYFRTREDLVMETLCEVEAILITKVVDSVDFENLSVHDALASMVAAFDDATRNDPDVIKVWLDWSTGFRDEVWQRYLLMQERVYAAVQRTLTRAKRQGILSERLNAKAAARLFVGGGSTIALARVAGAGEREIQTLTDHLIASVLSIGLTPDPPAVPAKGRPAVRGKSRI